MKILFTGALVPEEYSLEIKSNSLAGNRFQNNFINELRKFYEVEIISFIAVPLTNENKKKIDQYNLKSKDKYFYKKNNLIKSILSYRNYVKSRIKQYDVVITFNVNYPWINLPHFNRKVKSVLFLSDFSDVGSYNNFFMKVYAYICKLDFKKYDLVLYLSKFSERYLKYNQKRLYIPGGIDPKSFKNVFPIAPSNSYTVMYSGALVKVTGIDLLIKAFKKIKRQNIQLLITGRGELEDYVRKNAKGNIRYLESLNYKEYVKTLNNANILVNPRNMNLEENINNFPSKMFDYLSVGKIIVSTKFSGYENFIHNCIFCDSNVESIQKGLEYALDNYSSLYLNVYKKNTKEAKKYNWNIQVKKIINELNIENK